MVEIFEDGALIRYYFEGSPEARAAEDEFFAKSDGKAIQERIERRGNWLRRYAEQHIEVSDDLKTQYTVHPRGGSGGTLQWEGGFSVSPAIPSLAQSLRLAIMKLDFPWDMPGQVATISSPATFVIDL
jgi:hypothetical protein